MSTAGEENTLAAPRSLVHFGRFQLNLETGELRRDERLVRLSPQPTRLLCHLVTHAGHLVTREELGLLLWEGRAVEEDQGLNSCMLQIRRALGDRARNPIFIETVPRRGYCFIAPIEKKTLDPEPSGPDSLGAESWESDSPDPGSPDPGQQPGQQSQPPGLIRRRPVLLLAATAAVMMIVGWLWLALDDRAVDPALDELYEAVPREGDREGGREGDREGDRAPRIVVLPFRSLDDDHSYFAEGLTEEITVELASEQRLSVIADDSARIGARKQLALRELAELLDVDYIVEGTVRRDRERYRVSARLSDARAETLVWTQSFDRPADELLDVQVDVASRVVSSLVGRGLELSPRRRQTTTAVAGADPARSAGHESFLIGRHLLKHGERSQLPVAISYLEEAVAKDPDAAGARLFLARARLIAGQTDQEAYRRAVLSALDLAPELASAHLALGRLRLYADWNFVGARDSYEAALRYEPSSPEAHHALAMLLAIVGRAEEAIGHMERARSLDPVSFTLFADAGQVYFIARRFEESVEVCSRAYELDPSRVGLLQCRLDALLQLGRTSEALADAHLLMESHGAAADELSLIALGSDEERLEHFYRWQLSMLQKASAPPTALAAALLPLGEIDRCFEQLEIALQTRSSGVLLVPADPRADAFKDDPRLISLVERIGLPVVL